MTNSLFSFKIEYECRSGRTDISEVVNVIADEQFINPENGAFDLEKARLLVYSHGHYYGIGKEIGKFGWSVQKKKKKK